MSYHQLYSLERHETVQINLGSTLVMASNIVSDDPLCLTCKLCNHPYKHKDGPVMLQCLHSFCKQCLTEYINKQENVDNKMGCPTCNNRFHLPNEANFDFPINLRLSHLAKTKTYQQQAEGGNVKCQICEDTPRDATTFYSNRCVFVCDKCKRDYQRLLLDEDHEFIDITKKQELRVHCPSSKCKVHMKHDLELFCNDCKTLICSICSQTEHDGHKRSSLGTVSEKEKAGLQQLTNGIDNALGAMDETLQQIQETREKVKVSAKEATNRINKACDDLILAVENRREALKRRCQDISEGKDDVLSNQAIEMEQLRNNLWFAQLHAEDAINNHSPEEVLSVKKVIETRLNHSMEKYQRLSLDLREDDTINTMLEIEPLLEGIEKMGFFPSVPEPSKCLVEGITLQVSIVGKETEMCVALKDETGIPVQGKCHFQYELRKMDEDPDKHIPPKVTVTQCNNGTARLGFTPDQLGEYEMIVMIRNKPIADLLKITAVQSRDYKCFPIKKGTRKFIGVVPVE